MFLEQLIMTAILCAAWSRKTQFGYKLNVYGAVGIISIHSPDYVFMVLVSIFMIKTHNHFSSAISVL